MHSDDTFTAAERDLLAPYFTNLDGPVFALRNLPEVVKGALFARYSRSPKTLRRLFLDEFLGGGGGAGAMAEVGLARSEQLYEKVFLEYGDDSVAQLGGAHVACEGVSNILTKVLEWGRLMSYLEQSTRYIPFTDRPGGRWKYTVPAELDSVPELRRRYEAQLDASFATYTRLLPLLQEHLARRFPPTAGVSEAAHRRAVHAKALDALRGLLPAATRSNLGIYGSGQAFEHLLLRLRSHPLAEARACGERLLVELRKVMPAFLQRVDLPERGGLWAEYLADTRDRTREVARQLLAGIAPEPRDPVTLTEFDPEGEVKLVAAALYAASDLPDDQILERARAMDARQREAVLHAYVGERRNRRHRPGRAFERIAYRFDVVADYGAFRDLQRHRMLTLDWQPLGTRLGYVTPPEVGEAGREAEWHAVMMGAAELCAGLDGAGLASVSGYAVPMAYRVRFVAQLNAREAMHMLELRTSPQGHPSYRAICQRMHELIRGTAGHTAVAAAMRFVDSSPVDLERLDAEVALERRRTGASS